MRDLDRFRDELADQALPALRDERAVDPYRMPGSESRPTPSLKLPRAPRVSPGWTILFGTVPYLATVAAVLGSIHWRDDFGIDLLHSMVGFETAIYLGRAFWIGPGPAWTRLLTSSLCMAAVACSPTLAGVVGGADWTRTHDILFMILLAACVGVMCLVVNSFFFAIGSRDVPYRRRARHGFRGNLSAALAAAALFAAALSPIVFQPRLLTLDTEGLPVEPTELATAGAVMGVVLSLITQTWRWGVRGLRRLRSWKTVAFALVAILCTVPFVVLVYAGIRDERQASDMWAPIAAFVAVPVAREFLIRWVGYRAINVYAERRRKARRRRSL